MTTPTDPRAEMIAKLRDGIASLQETIRPTCGHSVAAHVARGSCGAHLQSMRTALDAFEVWSSIVPVSPMTPVEFKEAADRG